MASRPASRPPLSEASQRVLNAQPPQADHARPRRPSLPHHESLKPNGLLQVYHRSRQADMHAGKENQAPAGAGASTLAHPSQQISRSPSPSSICAVNPRMSAISRDDEDKRNSQISTTSTTASSGGKIKGLIGPWQLGKTLGKGATARVRKGRHRYTGQDAAIKIVQKASAKISQAGSLADLDAAEAISHDEPFGVRRMPIGIEREVAFMKLIQHPHVLQLYDIWENRLEIYLILELVDGGELFEYIASRGCLDEAESIRIFRQMLSAVGFCHEYKICHRDLKPENILLTKDGDVRVADFGMAALHQGASHKLNTSCGSPHYAAPELIAGQGYKGEKVDTWSMGVILFVMLAGRLPFDVNCNEEKWLQKLLNTIRHGVFEMPSHISNEASSLLWRMLQVDPSDRITIGQIWKHPIVRRYDYFDNFGTGPAVPAPMPQLKTPLTHRDQIDRDLLRQLRAMWHLMSEGALIKALLKDGTNEQKIFYAMLAKFRDEQLENYIPDLDYSTSDYHHVRPKALTKTYSTCEFQHPPASKHGRQSSRFTVISTAAETVQSYDPFKASRPQHLDGMRNDHAKITIHRTRPSDEGAELQRSMTRSTSARPPTRNPRLSNVSMSTDRDHRSASARLSRASLASSNRSRHSGRQIRVQAHYKRGVSFTHVRERSVSSQRKAAAGTRSSGVGNPHGSSHEAVNINVDHHQHVDKSSYHAAASARSWKTHTRNGAVALWTSAFYNDDVRQVSSGFAKDCDAAFNGSSPLAGPEAARAQRTDGQKHPSLHSRPLPPPPERSESVQEQLLQAKRHAELHQRQGDLSQSHINRMVTHLDSLMALKNDSRRDNRRIVSAPSDGGSAYHGRHQGLPSIVERGYEERSPLDHVYEAKSARTASAPEPHDLYAARDPQQIRVVNSPSTLSPVRMPAPLTIRKLSSIESGATAPPMNNAAYGQTGGRQQYSGLDLRQRYHVGGGGPELGRIDENGFGGEDEGSSSAGTVLRHKPSSWFKRSSKSSGEELMQKTPSPSSYGNGHHTSVLDDIAPLVSAPPLPKKKKKKNIIQRLFTKAVKPGMSVNKNIHPTDSLNGPAPASSSPEHRPIEVQQSWIARLFHVKPLCRYWCFEVPRRRARMEIVGLLRDWRQYGMRDVHVDRERNVVFARVGKRNLLEINEVSFAFEILTVIEHGAHGGHGGHGGQGVQGGHSSSSASAPPSRLSIARVTQERGAASSFTRIVDTMGSVFQCKGLLVADEQKRRMMVRTLQAAEK